MLVATTNDLPGYRVVAHLGLVRGVTVRSRSVIGNIGGSIQSIFGGKLSIYVNLAAAARKAHGQLTLVVDGLTTQAKYYKPLIYEFFRKVWRGSRPAWGEFSVEIGMEFVGDPPWMDLDNLAKALLDAIKGYAFHDDAQVARLLVERRPAERERIVIVVRKLESRFLRSTLED